MLAALQQSVLINVSFSTGVRVVPPPRLPGPQAAATGGRPQVLQIGAGG